MCQVREEIFQSLHDFPNLHVLNDFKSHREVQCHFQQIDSVEVVVDESVDPIVDLCVRVDHFRNIRGVGGERIEVLIDFINDDQVVVLLHKAFQSP
ncbi:hypothetical protein WICPIJ_009202 [Wickerhamomyces pijperi]|uniref:Uncharacterized protein n=1 Tax=Wickerhamomyces pijperi TaxID=599730 RepID=A0A9P8TF68_WICPI|nr:hypothetical protein WICPIJ_009202 [Wickerhamomyces pijperi]